MLKVVMTLKEICQSKIKYKNKSKAWQAAYFYYKSLGTETGAYRCWICKHYHLSKKVKMDIPIDIIAKEKFKEANWFEKQIYNLIKMVLSFSYKKKLRRFKQFLFEKRQQLWRRIRKGKKYITKKRQFKNEVLPDKEMKEILRNLNK